MASRQIMASGGLITQVRGRRRTLTPAPWLPPVNDENTNKNVLDSSTKSLLDEVITADIVNTVKKGVDASSEATASISEIPFTSRRVGLIVRKIGMIPQWTSVGNRILCTMLHVEENNVVSVVSPDDWYRNSLVGKRKAFNRLGPMWKVTVGAVNDDANKYSHIYRRQFLKAGVPVKQQLGSFLVSEDALPVVGQYLDARHFTIGQFISASGRTVDWGFQGGMHRWGMRGQPSRRTTKSHRRIGSVGSVGDARIWPGKRMPGHMGYEWVTVSGLEVLRMNIDKQVIYVKGSVPGDVGELLLLKDCVQQEKKLTSGPMPTWTPSLETIPEESEDQSPLQKELLYREAVSPKLFRFTSPSVLFSDADVKKVAGRDKTKAKIAKVKK
ncbi:unnamed protein product [Caenorhabditis auriculariae]|uniref:Large ribosomal subunit protein uL3m n=1 Tax=Caenorhabditis auriculariae TaxID=2777116 RepID=A0A8S1GYD5_9PELO|nr:unnamed protein product [Caenorhabditis auriculariae]